MKKLPLGSIALLLLVKYYNCLESVTLRHSPVAVHVGDEVMLSVYYSFSQGETLHQIKFYKDQEEFFRYTPSDPPFNRVFRVSGLKIDTARSEGQIVYLSDVTSASSGRFSVEVTLDAPHFTTKTASKEIQVLPRARDVSAGRNGTRLFNLKYLRKMEEKLNKPREEWPKEVADFILGQRKDGFDIIKIAAFGYVNHISSHTLEQVLRETNASKALIDVTSAVATLYDAWTDSPDLRKMTVAYCVERSGYFNLDQEPKNPPVNRTQGAAPPCDCHCVKDTNKINGTLPSLELEKHP